MSCTVYVYTCQQLTVMIWYCFRLMTAAREAACWDTPTTPPRPRPRHTTTTMATPPGRDRGQGTSSSTSTVHRSVEIFLLEYKNIFVSWKDWILLHGTQLVFCHWIQIFFLEYKVYCHVMMKYFLTIIIIQDVLCAIMTVSLKDWCFGWSFHVRGLYGSKIEQFKMKLLLWWVNEAWYWDVFRDGTRDGLLNTVSLCQPVVYSFSKIGS